ncbi:S8 family serine peptidase [Sneathiella sp. P13V-1]|uniref:S8 family serine peptidase n=1 Tax=Sneathiella sp. P13V-1 TaxID=2697366 RepID=UPI00187B8487|nr:S8 family serine peptidase [Sneathiella sp. P13V-1]MBE7636173.1 S8 family serine peptidase [Sneathiella sp. P13V-1]
MTHLLLKMMLVSALWSWSCAANAQTAPTDPAGSPSSSVPGTSTPRPGTAPLTLPARRVLGGASLKPAQFLRFEGSCLPPQGIWRLVGSNFAEGRSTAYRLYLKSSKGDKKALPISSVRKNVISSRISSSDFLEKGQKYWFELYVGQQIVEGPGNRLRLERCTDETPLLSPSREREYLPREILVQLPFSAFSEAEKQSIVSQLQSLGYTIARDETLEVLEVYLLRIGTGAGADLPSLIDELRNRYPEAQIDFNHIATLANGRKHYGRKLSGLPVPPLQCGVLETLQTRVGIVDGGANLNHSALKSVPNVHMARFGDGISAGSIASAHGTAILSQYKGADKELDLRGLLPNSHVFLADVLDEESGSGNSFTVITGLNWLAKRNVDIVSISMEGPPNRLLEKVFQTLDRLGVFVIAAAGNGGHRGKAVFPAAYPSVITVTAVGPTRSIYGKANQGSFVDIAAPGSSIWLARKDTGASYQTGTSFAVPFVVSKAALVLGSRSKGSGFTHTDLRQALIQHVIDLGTTGRDDVFGAGLVQFFNCE